MPIAVTPPGEILPTRQHESACVRSTACPRPFVRFRGLIFARIALQWPSRIGADRLRRGTDSPFGAVAPSGRARLPQRLTFSPEGISVRRTLLPHPLRDGVER